MSQPANTVSLIGPPAGGMLMLTDQSGQEAARLSVSGPDDIDPSKRHTSTLSLVSVAPTLEMLGSAGYQTIIGTTDLVTTATGETHRTSAASVVLLDDKGHIIWRAP